MAAIKIQRYAVQFKTGDNIGNVVLEFSTGQTYTLKNLSADAFNAVNNMLDNDPVYFDPDTNWFSSQLEFPKDA